MSSAEQSTLGGLMLDNSAFHEIELHPHDFKIPIHSRMYEAITDLINKGEAADVLTVAQWIDKHYHDTDQDYGYIVEVANHTPSAKNVPSYAKIVRDESRTRQAKQLIARAKDAIDERGAEAIDDIIADMMDIVDEQTKYETTLFDAVHKAAERLDWLEKNPGLIGIPTGIDKLDTFLGGFQKPDLYVIGARPAMGKTALLLNMLLSANKPVGLFSAEQPDIQIGQRVIAIAGGASTSNMRQGKMTGDDWQAVTRTLARMKNDNTVMNHQSAPSLIDVVRQTRKWKRERNIQAIYLDYIQRMKGPKGMKRHEQVEEIIRGLKELAKELDIAVVALAQVGRDVEKRQDKRPHMADLKDSGAIEQEADNVIMLYRDEVYNEHTKLKGVAELSVEKNRHGRTGYIYAKWSPETMVFGNMTDPEYQGGDNDIPF